MAVPAQATSAATTQSAAARVSVCHDITGFSQKQLRKVGRKSRAAAKRLSGWQPPPPPDLASSSEGELKTDIASVLARAILQRRALSRQSLEADDDDDAGAWE